MPIVSSSQTPRPGSNWRWNWASDPEGLALSSLASLESRTAGAWAATRVAERIRAAAQEQYRRRAAEEERQAEEQLAAFRQQQLELAPARRQALPAHAVWVAWHYARGKTQKVIAAELGVTSMTVGTLVRRYIEAWLPEALAPRPQHWGDGPLYIDGYKPELLRRHFGDQPEPDVEGPLRVVRSKAAKRRLLTWYAGRGNLGRPIDMGGPRDCWVEYTLEANTP